MPRITTARSSLTDLWPGLPWATKQKILRRLEGERPLRHERAPEYLVYAQLTPDTPDQIELRRAAILGKRPAPGRPPSRSRRTRRAWVELRRQLQACEHLPPEVVAADLGITLGGIWKAAVRHAEPELGVRYRRAERQYLKVRQYGNAVTPPVSEVLMSALVECITGQDVP